jgi:hypothetical protein
MHNHSCAFPLKIAGSCQQVAPSLYQFASDPTKIFEEKDQRCIFVGNEQMLVKRSVYSCKEKANLPYVVFIKLPLVKTVISSKCIKRDTRKFIFKENDVFLFIGVTDNKNQRPILHRIGDTPACLSGCKCTQRRTDVPQDAYAPVGDCVQGPFTVKRFGVARRERQASGPRQRTLPNVALVEIEMDGHPTWVEQEICHALVDANFYDSICSYSGVRFQFNVSNKCSSLSDSDYIMMTNECHQKSLFNHFKLPYIAPYTSSDFDQEPKMSGRLGHSKDRKTKRNSINKHSTKSTPKIKRGKVDIEEVDTVVVPEPVPPQELLNTGGWASDDANSSEMDTEDTEYAQLRPVHFMHPGYYANLFPAMSASPQVVPNSDTEDQLILFSGGGGFGSDIDFGASARAIPQETVDGDGDDVSFLLKSTDCFVQHHPCDDTMGDVPDINSTFAE